MNAVFCDTSYFIALLNPDDDAHESVATALEALDGFQYVTTHDVLTELLNYFAEWGSQFRQLGSQLIRELKSRPDTIILHQSNDLFLSGFELYDERPDQGYSLTDCISMHVARNHGISKVLTTDSDFQAEGFEILLG